ncbi:MAG: GldG family protein [Chloroflexi bacterium]|nr:GldG family protein [Chloroflexota bacterium]
MNKHTWRAWLPWASLILAMVSLAVAAGAYVITRAWDTPVRVALAVAIIAFAVYLSLESDRIRAWLRGRQARYGSNTLLMTLAVIGILGSINYLASLYPKRWDLTEDKANTLAPEVQELLANLPEDVTAYAFYSAQADTTYAKELLDKFALASNGKFAYKFIDPLLQPGMAQKYGVTRDGTIVLVMGDRSELVTFASESELANALVRLLHPENQVVYFIIGHGEADLEAFGDQGLSMFKDELESKNYTVKTLTLATEKAIPDDAKVLVVAGPMQPFQEHELQLLKEYLENGGSVVFFFNTSIEGAQEPDANLAAYLEDTWGIIVDNDVVIDPTSPQQPFLVMAAIYEPHPITQKLTNLVTIFPIARSVRLANPDDPLRLGTEIIKTAPQAWGETDLTAFQATEGQEGTIANLEPNPETDIMGPVPLAVALEDTQSGARIVVVGDADFVRNGAYPAYGNGLLAVNAVEWAANLGDLIKLTPRETVQRQLKPPNSYLLNTIFLTSVCLLPGAVLLLGAFVIIRRRLRT